VADGARVIFLGYFSAAHAGAQADLTIETRFAGEVSPRLRGVSSFPNL